MDSHEYSPKKLFLITTRYETNAKLHVFRLPPAVVAENLKKIRVDYPQILKRYEIKVNDLIDQGLFQPDESFEDFVQKAFTKVWHKAKRQENNGGLTLRFKGEDTEEHRMNTFAKYVSTTISREIGQKIRRAKSRRRVLKNTLFVKGNNPIIPIFYSDQGREYGVSQTGHDTKAGEYTNLKRLDLDRISGYRADDEIAVRNVSYAERFSKLSKRKDFKRLLHYVGLPQKASEVKNINHNDIELLDIAAFLVDAYFPGKKHQKLVDIKMPLTQLISLLHELRGVDISDTAQFLRCKVDNVYVYRKRALYWLEKWRRFNKDKLIPGMSDRLM